MNLKIHASPKPVFQLTLDDRPINPESVIIVNEEEDFPDSSKRVVIKVVNDQTEGMYKLSAQNTFGKSVYSVSVISLSWDEV